TCVIHLSGDSLTLTGTLSAAPHAEGTLFHVAAEPPAIYAHLVQLEENVDALLASGSELGRNLVAEKKALENLGVAVNVRVRHGFVVDQLLDEMRGGNYDLIVSGSSRARGPLRYYIMGDVTQRILDSAECAVLVARSQPPGPAKGL